MKHKYLSASLVIVGGGLSGVCAALEAARLGMTVILAHNRPVLGGNSSSEIRVWTRGATGAGTLFGEEMGILGRLKMRNLYVNPDYNPIFWDEVLLDGVLGEKNITLLLNTNIEQVVCRNGRIMELYGVQQASELAYTLNGEYYIDATGDGMIGEQAGILYEVGDGLYQTGDDLQKRELLSSSILYYVKDMGKPVPFIAPEYVHDMAYIQTLVNKGGRIISEKQTGSDCWWFEYGGLCNTISGSQEIGMELRRLVLGIWNYIKNSGKYPEAENYTLEWIGSIPGKRESRRMVTEYMLCQEDLLEQREFEDAAFYGGWYMDFHPAEGLSSKKNNCVQIPVNIYAVPFRCLYNRKVENLLFAGRNIGTKREAFSSARVMNTCALSGQAAAVLAWGCQLWKKHPAELTGVQIRKLQDLLQREDMFIPGRRLCETEDLARNARITASSEYVLLPEPEEEYFKLDAGAFLTLPKAEGSSVVIEIQNDGETDTELEMEYYVSDLPSRLRPGKLEAENKITLVSGVQKVMLSLPQKERKFCTVVFAANEKIGIRKNKRRNPGILLGRKDSSRYCDPCLWWQPEGLYAAESVVNGYIRPYQGVNIWCSEAEENPWLLLEWEQPVSFREIRLFFEPEFSMEIPSSCAGRWDESHKFTLRNTMPPQLARELSVEVYSREQWIEISRVCDNWNRLLVLDFDRTVTAEKLRINFKRSWGDSRAQLYQISIYKNKINEEKEDFSV